MCRLLKVSCASYYQRRTGALSERAVADAALSVRIASIHQESDGTYGSPRVHQVLRRHSAGCGKRRVARLMRAAGLEGRRKKRWRTTTIADPAAEAARDLIARDFAQLDAAFVRGVTTAPGVDLIEVWQDRLLAALPASHELARQETVALSDLASLPLRLVPRPRNPPLVDLVLAACGQAGFAPVPGSPLDALENVLAAISAGAPSWTMLYEPHARGLHQPRVAFRRTEPALFMPTALAVREGAGSRLLAPLLQACATAGLADQDLTDQDP